MYVKDKPLYLAQMYAVATRLAIVDFSRLIACEFAVISDLPGEGEHEWTEWLGLVTYIYKSTPSTARDLRNRVVVIWQSAVSGLSAGEFLHNDMLELLQATLQETPEFGFDIATMPLAKSFYQCLHCEKYSFALALRCIHEPKHAYGHFSCFEEGLMAQTCCHYFAVEALDPDESKSATWKRR